MKNIKNNYVVLLLVLIISGCYTRVEKTKELYSELKLYNLNNGERIILEIDDVNNNSGKIYGELKNGSNVEGEFYLDGPKYPRYQNQPMIQTKKVGLLSEFINKKIGNDKSKSNYSEEFIKSSFPVLYGYSNNSNVTPIGSCVIISENDLLIESIFYKIDFERRIGDGIAKDNQGNIYRVYLSSEYIYQ